MDCMRFLTALRDEARRKIEKISKADIVIGIPTYYSCGTIEFVIKMVAEGLRKYFPGKKSIIFISDGGSTDDTREVAMDVDITNFNQEKIVTIYRGLPGKGSAIRAIFEASSFLGADAVALFDSDLKSIKPEWIKNVLEPVFYGYDFVTPYYTRYKFDGTITNTIVYNLTRALFGANIRQPIGGDFGISRELIREYLRKDVWESDIAKFGIDIWLTVEAIVNKFRICQTRLGVKIHGEKDPAADLSGMFTQVVGTIFKLMIDNEDYWKEVKGSVDIPILGDVPEEEAKPFQINKKALLDYFRAGYKNFGSVWKNIIEVDDYKVVEELFRLSRRSPNRVILPVKTWAHIVYDYAIAFKKTDIQRFKLLGTLIPIYNLRVASMVNELKDIDDLDAEKYFEEQAKVFEEEKEYLLKKW